MKRNSWIALIIVSLLVSLVIDIPLFIPSIDVPIDGVSIGIPDNYSEYQCLYLIPLIFLNICWGEINWESKFISVLFITIEY